MTCQVLPVKYSTCGSYKICEFQCMRPPKSSKRREGPRLIGYARVSTSEQSLDMQTGALERAGVHPDDIYSEHVSGVSSKRIQLELAFATMLAGDTLVVWKLDRMGRSLLDLLAKMKRLDEAGVGFRSLTEGIDTTTPGGRLIMMVMGALAEFERGIIVERTKAGMKAYIARGGKPGQPSKLTDEDVEEIKQMVLGGIPLAQAAVKHKVSINTIYNRLGRSTIRKLRKQARTTN